MPPNTCVMHGLRVLLPVVALASASAAPVGRAVPLLFTPNHGQAHAGARFVARTPRLNVYFERRQTVFELRDTALRVQFVDATGGGDAEARQSARGVANYLIGSEEAWVIGVPLLEGVVYRDIYPEVDAVYSGSGPDLKSEYIVRPGQDPGCIRLRYAGADRVEVMPDGSLSIAVGRHTLRESAPVLYQQRGGDRLRVEGGFSVNGDVVSFIVGGYDRSLPLIIDPVFSYVTLVGGSGMDAAMSLAVDSSGAAYLAGFSSSYDLPVANPAQPVSGGGNDAFVAKLAADGSGLVYCTYIGGRGDDRAYGIAVDSSGAAYVTGSTASSNFPVRAAFQPKLAGGRNAFVLKLNPAGNSLVYSTYLGGSAADSASGIALDASGNAYVTGDATSSNFPATAYQTSNRGAPDAFVAKVAADGSRLLYSTYLGGNSEDHATGIAVDGSGSAVITGSTYSADFPVSNAYQARLAGGQDAFVAKLAADGRSLIFSTYLGGSGGIVGAPESGRGVALDSAGNVYVAGETSSTNFPIRGALQSTNAGWQDAFVSKFGGTGTLIYSTYLGGLNLDAANAIAVDKSGAAYVAGQSTSAMLASIPVSQRAPTGVWDVFAMKLSAAGDAVAGWNYFGGSGADTATAVALDSSANLYIAGWTQSPDFAVVNGFQSVNGGNYGAFVGKMNFGASSVTVTVAPGAVTLQTAQMQQFTATVANASNTAVTWSLNPAVGSISAAGLYTAPAVISSQQVVTVRATSVADPSKSGAATVTLAAVTVAVSPSTVSLKALQTQQFSATVSNTANTAVQWTLSPSGAGTISSTGFYTAPASVSTAQAVTVTATSVADVSKSSTAIVNLSPGSVASNLALGKVATQSSIVAPASRAVDGNTDGNYFNASVAHTALDPNAWWQVDLGASYSISAVTLWNRTDCCGDRLGDYWVFVSDMPFNSGDTPAALQSRAGTWGGRQTTAPQPSATVMPNAQGRYVRIQLSGTNNLQLAEVQVFGSTAAIAIAPSAVTLNPGQTQQFTATVQGSPGAAVTWSISPNLGTMTVGGLYTAPASVASARSVVITATSVADPSKMATTTVNLQTSGVLANLAAGKTATQSSTFGVGAAAALDGNTDGSYFNGSVSQTNVEIGAWWQVDLGAAATIASVTIWNRTDCCQSRLADYWIFVSSTAFAAGDTPATLQARGVWGTHQTTAPNPSATIPIAAHGRYVRIQLTGLNALHMAEVQVSGAWLADDIAIGKAASQSTSWAPASRAVDGNTDGNYFNNSVTQTALEPNAWWQVDLGASAGVASIAIWNRTDCCITRLSDYWVFVSDTAFAASDTPTTLQTRAGTWGSHQTSAPNPAAVIPAGVTGRYVRVQLSGTNNLHMAEVEVFRALP